MATNNPRGFKALRSLNGNPIGNTRRYRVSSLSTRVYIGDPLELLTTGNVRVMTAAGSTGSPGVLGIVNGLLDNNQRPLTHSLPGSGQFIAASAQGYVDVVDDPQATFLVSTDATADQSMIGKFVDVTAGSANSAAGISGFHLSLTTATNIARGHRFRIIGVGPNETATGGIGDGGFALNQDMEVIISDHEWNRSHVRTGLPVSANPS